MKKTLYIASAAAALFLNSCDIEMVPKGQTTLETGQEIEYLLNYLEVRDEPGSDLSVIVNESYGQEFTTVKQLINNTNTLLSAYLSYNESVDRPNLAAKDRRYSSIYSAINTLNVALGKIDGTDADDALKLRVKAEAHIKRAWLHFLAANVYCAQYDPATAAEKGGIAYVTDYTMDQKKQLPLDRVYELILEDLADEYINDLPDKAQSVVRCSKATGNAIKARVLLQMKRYSEALTYAEKSLSQYSVLENRLSTIETGAWLLLPTAENNLLYVSPSGESWWCPFADKLSIEAAALFEAGDVVMDYGDVGYGGGLWNSMYGEMLTGVDGSMSFMGWDTYKNAWGLTVESMKYIAAECLIRSGQIDKGLAHVNDVRELRIDPDVYQPFTASTEKEAMEKMQQAKFIEFLMTFENFFDRKRWNTEDAYKKTITRDIPGVGKYSISPESPLWILPIPIAVMNNNPDFEQNI